MQGLQCRYSECRWTFYGFSPHFAVTGISAHYKGKPVVLKSGVDGVCLVSVRTCWSLRNDTTASRFSRRVTTAWAGTVAKLHFSYSLISAEPVGQRSLKFEDFKLLAHSGPLPGERCRILHKYKSEDIN